MKKHVQLLKIVLGSTALLAFLFCCTQGQNRSQATEDAANPETSNAVVTTGNTIASRFLLPAGYRRVDAEPGSFAQYLQQLTLKPDGSRVQYFNGAVKANNVHAAVLDVSVGDKDLQQCADALMRLRAEYFYSKKAFDSIEFNLTNGFAVPFSKWADGYRVTVRGNECSWQQSSANDRGRASFQKYLEFIYSYAGTLSLAKSLREKPISEINIGDVFIRGGSPGHAIIVADMALNEKGDKIFLLAQSYMPAQDIHILNNFENTATSPWYSLPDADVLQTPEWTFSVDELKSW